VESLKMSDKLTTALQELAISPIKQDRLAIERLEKQYGASLLEIINQFENDAIVHQSIQDERAKPKNIVRSLSAIAADNDSILLLAYV
jgi:hypothetical protein